MKTFFEILGAILIVVVFIVGVIWGIVKIVNSFPKKVYMTNEQIIQETKKCEDAGLIALKYPTYVVNDVEAIKCSPKENTQPVTNEQDIKKSNITNVNISPSSPALKE